MTDDSDNQEKGNQITQWLKKLQQESWQLELLVSAFTIFLLITASREYTEFYDGLPLTYNIDGVAAIVYLFLGLIGVSIRALALFLVIHLLLRGFWIGSIGLRSVQASIDFDGLKYSKYFTEKLKKRITSLDNVVIQLDEICSVIFSFSFLVISIILSFGLYILFLGLLALLLGTLAGLASGWVENALAIFMAVLFLGILFTGLIYLIDYFTLGFFKKYKRISKIYYPIYWFYGYVTLSFISRSIYYYLISKFSKKRIRVVYSIMLALLFLNALIDFDQYQYYPEGDNNLEMEANFYDNMRDTDDFIYKASIQSNVIGDPYIQLFIRYEPENNRDIRRVCPDFEPMKSDGLNPRLYLDTEGGNFIIRGRNFDEEDKEMLLTCLGDFYHVTVNDSVYSDLKFYFFKHPAHNQMGLVTMLGTSHLPAGENLLEVKRRMFNAQDSVLVPRDYAFIPFWKE